MRYEQKMVYQGGLVTLTKKIFIISILVLFGIFALILFFPFPTNKSYNANDAMVEIFLQERRASPLVFDENGEFHFLADNDCYYIGIDNHRNLYVRNGDGIAILTYITKKNDSTGDLYYNGYEDLIPKPKTETTYSLSLFEYYKIKHILKKISTMYEASGSITAIEVVGLEAPYYKYYKYKNKYYNIVDAESLELEIVQPYYEMEKIVFSHIGINQYPDDSRKTRVTAP